jgi:2-dehydro-3-deoxy-D-arabinonate dehydratase
MIKLLQTKQGIVVETERGTFRAGTDDFDALLNSEDLISKLSAADEPVTVCEDDILAPLGSQEVWAAGVTYYRSRDARMDESESAGGGDFYARVYNADRPELFFKGMASRVVGHGGKVRIRSDSKWNVPEPELTVVANCRGEIIGFTIGNDMSSRDIEGANPLYLPQAKVYDRCCGLGPAILITDQPLDDSVRIQLSINRNGKAVFAGETDLSQLKRKPAELVDWLYRDNTFPSGSFLLTGTGIIPPNEFTLAGGDIICITIDQIGTLQNTVM